MRTFRTKATALVAASLGVAAILGGSLGVVAAGVRQPLSAGFNLAGGPLNGDVSPAEYIACLPTSSWNSVYIWDGPSQTWRHYFNTASGVPAYVNQSTAGGIATIPRGAGVVLLMNSSVASPRLKDSNAESCGG
ncbi:MAG: hypothetical protein ACKVVT_15480 [Dehalococcoidia bacterium]